MWRVRIFIYENEKTNFDVDCVDVFSDCGRCWEGGLCGVEVSFSVDEINEV
jgi:hypothetical protein